MQHTLFDTYQEMAKNSFETLRTLGNLQVQLADRLLQKHLDLSHVLMDSSVKSLETLGTAKGYQELMTHEAKRVQEVGQHCLKTVGETVALLNETRDSMTQVMEQQLQSVAKNVQETSETVKKAAVKAVA